MRKITFLFAIMALFGVVLANAAVTNSMGRNWNTTTSTTILASSGIAFPTLSTSYPITVDPNANVSGDEMVYNISSTTTTPLTVRPDASKNDTYKNPTDFVCPNVQMAASADFTTTFPAYFEGKVTGVATTISGLQINGTTSNTTYGTTAGLLFSDASTFDENKITGFTTFTLSKCRGGLAASTVSSIPAGTKSFRIYMQAKLVDNGDGTWKIDNTNGTAIAGVTTGYSARIAYVNATLTMPFANVTVNYYDADNTTSLIKSTTKADQVIDAVYTATSADKTSFTQDGYYYTYSSMQLDNQTVSADGLAHVDVLVKKFTAYTGNFDWTGATDGTWNELISNFNAGGNPLAYQVGNAVSFPEPASNKTISIPNAMDFAAQNITVSGSGYSFSGAGILSGTGTLYVNSGAGNTTSLNIANNLTGGVNVQSGAVELLSSTSAASVTMADNTKIKWNGSADLGSSTAKKAIVGSAVVNFDAISSSASTTTSNYFINFAATGNTTTTINMGLGNNLQSGTTNFNLLGTSQANLPAGVLLNVTNNTGGTARIQLSRDALTDRKLNLGAGVAITRGDGNGGVYTIGELNGAIGSYLEGENSTTAVTKEITYTIGSLNTNCEFAGSLIQYNNTSTNNNVNLNKVGTGKLKLSGTSSHNGTVTVTAGTLELTGALTGTNTATVAAGATLKGTGSIVGATTVNGVLEGSLNFGSDLTLAGTTNLVVNGFEATQFDLVSVVGTVTSGGTLNVTVNAATPSINTSIKLINAATYVGSFATVNAPANYTFDSATGMLTYTVGTKLSESTNNNFRVYPTVTRNLIQVEGDYITSVQVMNLVGQTVKELTTTTTAISLNNLSEGSYLVKVRFADNSVRVQRILLCK